MEDVLSWSYKDLCGQRLPAAERYFSSFGFAFSALCAEKAKQTIMSTLLPQANMGHHVGADNESEPAKRYSKIIARLPLRKIRSSNTSFKAFASVIFSTSCPIWARSLAP